MQTKPRILVVEDDPVLQSAIQSGLARMGWDVTVASDGDQGLALWKLGSFDAVSTDMDLPGLNGLSLARAILSQDKNTKIYMFSGNDAAAELIVEIGGQAFFSKTDTGTYLKAMKAVLEGIQKKAEVMVAA